MSPVEYFSHFKTIIHNTQLVYFLAFYSCYISSCWIGNLVHSITIFPIKFISLARCLDKVKSKDSSIRFIIC